MKTKLLWKSLASLLGAIFLFGLTVNAQTVSVNFTGMTPHIGQKLEARLISKKSLQEVDRSKIETITSATFSILLEGVIGESYYVDFYADLNGNGVYDSPPTDHAWRTDIGLESISSGITNVAFAHNTSFDEIGWMHELTLELSGMTPHLGQMLEARLLDINQNMKEVSRQSISSLTTNSFNLTFPGITVGNSYYIDFYADLNGNGVYNAPPVDHSWRIKLDNLLGDTTVSFMHNTNFMEIDWRYLLTIDIVDMSPHIGQMLELRVIDTDNDSEVGRIKRIVDTPPDLSVVMPVVQAGHSYTVDFYADLNGNGIYNSPPVDHAWRDTTAINLVENTTISFSHNANFTDVAWNYLLTFHAENMTPHLGQLFELRVIDTVSSLEIGRVRLDSIQTADFMLQVPGLEIGKAYQVDYYADLNGNGLYNSPPTDHAWREFFTDINGDTSLTFAHNTNFTDIIWPGIGIIEIQDGSKIKIFPNPFTHSLYIVGEEQEFVSVELYNFLGQSIQLSPGGLPGNYIEIENLNKLPNGIYLLKLTDQDDAYLFRIIKK